MVLFRTVKHGRCLLKDFTVNRLTNSIETIANADKNVPIRLFKVERSMSKTPQEDCNGTWNVNSPEYVADFSAAAYFLVSNFIIH